ncbi:hypothetical protein LTR17_005435 [Elasticomyces elasticus]|nr:hypothetical protein LTR17_005435 [Elasticomyces elasticus]
MDLRSMRSSITCFAGSTGAKGKSHNNLAALDGRIWRGSLSEPDRCVHGHPSWNEVLRMYRARLDGRSLEDKKLEKEMEDYMCTNVYKKQKEKEVFCAGCEHYASQEPCRNLEMVRFDVPPLNNRGIWMCEFLDGHHPVHTIVAFEVPEKGCIGHWQFWLTGGGYLPRLGLAAKRTLESADGNPIESATNTLDLDRDSNNFPGPMDSDRFLRQVETPLDRRESDTATSLSARLGFKPIDQTNTKRKVIESTTTGARKVLKYGPNSGVFALRSTPGVTPSTAISREQSSDAQPTIAPNYSPEYRHLATQQAEHPLKFRPRVQHDYSQQILDVFRDHEHLENCEQTKEWKNKAALQELSASDLQAVRKPVYFRGTFTSRMFNGSPYSNMEAALTQMSGTELRGSDVCERCQNGCGPFTTCVVGSELHKGACANCVYNSQASKCSLRKANQTSATGQPSPHIMNSNNNVGHVYPPPWTGVTSARPSLSEALIGGHDNRSEATSDGLFVRAATVSSGSELYRRTPGPVPQRIPDMPHGEQVPIRLASSEAGSQTHRREIHRAEMTAPYQTPGILASAAAADRASSSDEASGRRGQARSGPRAEDPISADPSGLFAAPAHDQSRTSGSVAASSSAARGSQQAPSENGSSVYDSAFLDYAAIELSIEDDATSVEVGLAGCSTFDALITKITTRPSLRRVLQDPLAISCIDFRIRNTSIWKSVEPGDVTVYSRLLRDIQTRFEQGGRQEVILDATVALSTRT